MLIICVLFIKKLSILDILYINNIMDIYFRPDLKVRSDTKITQDQFGEMIKKICSITLVKNKYNTYLNSEVETILDYYLDIKNKDQNSFVNSYLFELYYTKNRSKNP